MGGGNRGVFTLRSMVVGATLGDVVPAPQPDEALPVIASGFWGHHRPLETINRRIVVGSVGGGNKGLFPLRMMVVGATLGNVVPAP